VGVSITLRALESMRDHDAARLAAGLVAARTVVALGLGQGGDEEFREDVMPGRVARHAAAFVAALTSLRCLELCWDESSPYVCHWTWSCLLRLECLGALESLSVGRLGSCRGLETIAEAAPSLGRLTELRLSGSSYASAYKFLQQLSGLRALEGVELDHLRPWLPSLPLLTCLVLPDSGRYYDKHMHTVRAAAAADWLQLLPSLRELSFASWEPEGAQAAAQAALHAGVTKLKATLKRFADVTSLQLAFPGVADVDLLCMYTEGDVLPQPVQPWRGLRRIVIEHRFQYSGARFPVLRILGGLDLSQLRELSSQEGGVRDAELVALLRAAPRLERLRIDGARLTDAALTFHMHFARRPLCAGLQQLHIEWVRAGRRPSAAGLRALAVALPALERVQMDTYTADYDVREQVWERDFSGVGGALQAAGDLVLCSTRERSLF